jgi:hypothetical protein
MAQEQLAEAAGVKQSAVARLESLKAVFCQAKFPKIISRNSPVLTWGIPHFHHRQPGLLVQGHRV